MSSTTSWTPSIADTALAHHQIGALLITYLTIADRKDVEAAAQHLATAELAFPAGSSHDLESARALFGKLWANPVTHRHELSNLLVTPGDQPDQWHAQAYYTRWIIDPTPVLNTLGEYEVTVDGTDWTIRRMAVTRTWVDG